ncbi:hypothetical protein [Fimbriiglobus ruber]|uniref:Uncharacterized protein n=1 Tax=Fimbriiglobus ruber TaxID=1908690 RepID=A0A225E268_9BACT|nr:hypothetical protein [Fimbriiglobus ruber]OWK47333.1 hypothetical protein FRUB_01032 [Fimbriiglobus ruber]
MAVSAQHVKAQLRHFARQFEQFVRAWNQRVERWLSQHLSLTKNPKK